MVYSYICFKGTHTTEAFKRSNATKKRPFKNRLLLYNMEEDGSKWHLAIPGFV